MHPGTVPPPPPPAPVPPSGPSAAEHLTPAWPGGTSNGDQLGFSDQTYTAGTWSAAATASLVPRPAPPSGTDPVAIASLPAAIVVPPAGVVLAIVALVRTARSHQRGRVLATAALIAGSLLSALAVLLPLLVPSLVPRLTGTTDPVGPDVDGPVGVHVRQLTVGSCVRTVPSGGTVRTTVVPCGEEHEARVVSQYVFDDGSWPGDEEVAERVAASCTLSAEEVAAGVRAVALVPTEASWRQGDRQGLCLLTPDAL
ncbi:hypothetical protein ATL41_1835 [Flavimobilis soli]|uniref:Regulator of septum formation n=1 Tax=Flavimobilis soli TaxID=442709 RepID=A0A2A9EDG3_9MICO|nr:DUF4190 domain-containing protein [Flavimobilis soli]PFG37087.1 hypothetical protein ATL41_1835 [Flavimobilis soli]